MQEINVSVEQKNGTIGFNFEEIKEVLTAELQIYKGMVFTEDSKKEAKSTVADLRKLKKSVDDKKKEVKTSFMKPYTDFECKVKELQSLIDEPIGFINGQVEEFEQKRIEERKHLIQSIYDENISDAGEYLPLAKIYNDKWENATTSKKAITDEITERVKVLHDAITTIKSMDSDYEDKGLEVYKRSLSLTDAIQCINNYERQAAEIKKRQEEEKQEEVIEVVEPVVQQIIEEPKEEPETRKPTDSIIYEMKADAFQIAQLESYMREIGIDYRRVQ